MRAERLVIVDWCGARHHSPATNHELPLVAGRLALRRRRATLTGNTGLPNGRARRGFVDVRRLSLPFGMRRDSDDRLVQQTLELGVARAGVQTILHAGQRVARWDVGRDQLATHSERYFERTVGRYRADERCDAGRVAVAAEELCGGNDLAVARFLPVGGEEQVMRFTH